MAAGNTAGLGTVARVELMLLFYGCVLPLYVPTGASTSTDAPELERQARRRFALLPPCVATPNHSAAVLLHQAALRRKKRCGKGRRMDCQLRLAQALAADGQLVAAAAAAQLSLEEASPTATVDQRFEAAFVAFWFAQLSTHTTDGVAGGDGSGSGGDPAMEGATQALFGLLMTEPQRGANEWRSLLDCVGLLDALPRQTQVAACGDAGADSAPWSEEGGGFGFARATAQYWTGLLHLDGVVGSLLPDHFSPRSPSQGWRWATANSLRHISAGCAHLSMATSAADPALLSPQIAVANYSCAMLLEATTQRYNQRRGLQRSAAAAGAMWERHVGWPMSRLQPPVTEVERRANLSAAEFQRDYVAKSTPVIITDSGAFGLQVPGLARANQNPETSPIGKGGMGNRIGAAWLRKHCGHAVVLPSEVMWHEDAFPDSSEGDANLHAFGTTSAGNKKPLKLGKLLKSGKITAESGAAGVGGWKLDECASLRRLWRWSSLVPTRFGIKATDEAWRWQSPRLFKAPFNTSSSLHTDIYASHHFTALLEGTKSFRIFPPDVEHSANLLYNEFSSRFEQRADDMVWGASRGGWQVSMLYPGEMLYVPASCPHAVRHTKDAALSVGVNYVDVQNLERARLAAAITAAGANIELSRVEALGVLRALGM